MAKQSPKGLAALIIASKKPSKEEGPMMEMEDEVEDGESSVELESAAEEILMAMEQKDPKALTEALKAFVEMC
jgi:hypothetical protein